MTRVRRPKIVGVILAPADFSRALKMQNPPDYFELRLDGLVKHLEEVKRRAKDLRAPFIITARHPREGGMNALSANRRRALLLQFLENTEFIDIELGSLPAFAPVMREAAAHKISTILSFHDFKGTPSRKRLDQVVAEARAFNADLIKIAIRTDTKSQLKLLLDFFDDYRARKDVVATGMGRLGRQSRRELVRRGCILNYAHLGTAAVSGQLSVREIRQSLRHGRPFADAPHRVL